MINAKNTIIIITKDTDDAFILGSKYINFG
jgi:ABC-type proline/glycine betaine transport system ATPase subunit